MSQLDQALNKFGYATFDNRNPQPPFAKQADTVACRCASGSHTVWTNYLLGQDPTCHCEPDTIMPTTSNIKELTDYCSRLPAEAGYHYEYKDGRGCVLVFHGKNIPYGLQYSSMPSGVNIGELNPATPITSNAVESLKAFFAEHKLLVGAAVVGLGFYMFGGGLGASDRTVTSITRYTPKSKNGVKRRKRR